MLGVTAGLVLWYVAGERERFESASASTRSALRI